MRRFVFRDRKTMIFKSILRVKQWVQGTIHVKLELPTTHLISSVIGWAYQSTFNRSCAVNYATDIDYISRSESLRHSNDISRSGHAISAMTCSSSETTCPNSALPRCQLKKSWHAKSCAVIFEISSFYTQLFKYCGIRNESSRVQSVENIRSPRSSRTFLCFEFPCLKVAELNTECYMPDFKHFRGNSTVNMIDACHILICVLFLENVGDYFFRQMNDSLEMRFIKRCTENVLVLWKLFI